MKRTRVNRGHMVEPRAPKRVRVNQVAGRARSMPSKTYVAETFYVITTSGYVTLSGGRVTYNA